MFPLPLLTYVKLIAGVACLLGSFYFGWHFRDNQFQAYKAAIIAQNAAVEKEHQAAADQIRKDKDAQITSINAQLVDAISELRKRPSRAQNAANGQGGTGATLFAEDAEFLTREAARADIIREGLDACYKQYNSVSK